MEQQPGQCPFLKQECIQERCELYGEIQVSTPGPLAGSRVIGKHRGCAFNILVVELAATTAVSVPGQHGPDPTRH